MRRKGQTGVALVTTMLILLLMAGLLAGFTMLIQTDQRLGAVDRDRVKAMYAAHAGMEKLTSDLGVLFSANYAPTGAQVNALTATQAPSPGQPGWPVLPNINYVSPGGGPGSGYQIVYPVDARGNPAASNRTILTGPFQGFIGLITPYTVTVTAQTSISAATQTGSEVRLRRTVQTVAIPVFQFGFFSQTDLSFFPGPAFTSAGRVHTNGNLFLASGSTLTLADRVTAAQEVIRTNLSNGWVTSSGYNGNVNIINAPGSFRNLARTEGSLVGTLGSAWNEPTWTNLSIGTYNGNLRNGRTGAKTLSLPLVSMGAQPIDLIRRPVPNEDVNNPNVFSQRYFTSNPGTSNITSLRILLSDNGTDISTLPTVTAQLPVFLGNTSLPYAHLVPPGCRSFNFTSPQIASSTGSSANGYWTLANRNLIGGCIKIEMNNGASWVDVTDEILNLGIAGRNLNPAGAFPSAAQLAPIPSPQNCPERNPDAIIRIQRVRDLPAPATGAPCGLTSTTGTDFVPLTIFDPREATPRDNIAPTQTNVHLGGAMSYIEIDVTNLNRWFTGVIGGSGANAVRVDGLVVYISDRRGNLVDPTPSVNKKIGEFGWNDFVNPASATGAANGTLDTGEDIDGDGILRTYGGVPNLPAAIDRTLTPLTSWTTLGAANPQTLVTRLEARVNSPLFFRRAVKLVHGTTISLGTCNGVNCGLTLATENPVYIEGDYNAPGSSFAGAHAGCSVIADAVTLLSNSWNDVNSWSAPYNAMTGSLRKATPTWVRTAIVAGKGISFPQVPGTYQDFGTDGGAHNFFRLMEHWRARPMNYMGSVVSFYVNRQAVGTYKCCRNVYDPPARNYSFDTDFLTPALLPPRTPMFRDVNTTGFTQLIMPWQ